MEERTDSKEMDQLLDAARAMFDAYADIVERERMEGSGTHFFKPEEGRRRLNAAFCQSVRDMAAAMGSYLRSEIKQ